MKLKRVLNLKMSGDDVKFLQKELKRNSLYKKTITGVFSNETRLSVIEFQKKVGINPNGKVGMQTWEILLDFSKSKSKKKPDIPNNVIQVGEGFKIYDARIEDLLYNKIPKKKDTIWIKSSGTSYRPDMYINNWEPFYKKEKSGLPSISETGGYVELKTGYNYVIGGDHKKDSLWDGKILRIFEDEYWANNTQDKKLSSKTISISVCNLGPLTKIDKDYYNRDLIKVDKSEVVDVDYNGYKYWHRYTDNQIESLYGLIKHLINKLGISLEIDDDFLKYDRSKSKKRLVTDSNCIPGGFGLFPQKEIINMLNNL